MTAPTPTISRATGCFPALVSINAGIVAAWQWVFGNPDIAIWACWAFLMAGCYSTACRTIARQRAELAMLRDTVKERR